MKTILIATDFSKASHNATIYGIKLAQDINASVLLYNAYTVPTPPAGLALGISSYDIRVQMEDKLREEINGLQYLNMPLIMPVCDEGNTADAILSIAQEKKADFIVVGMKGNGKGFRKIFGSTATALAKKTNIPVIVVPEFAKYKSPRNIVFATEDIIASEKNLQESLNLISKLFKSKLNVVSVVKNEDEQPGVQQNATHHSDKVAYTFDTSFEYLVDADVKHALNDFIKSHHCNMLVMMPHKYDWVERLFKKSETKNMIFHSHVPLLVLPEAFFSEPDEVKINNYSAN